MSLIEYYLNFQRELRHRRTDWLERVFPKLVALERIVESIPWLSIEPKAGSLLRVRKLSENTARHHSVPRQGWLRELGLIEEDSKRLTRFGVSTLGAVTGDQPYFWLGPNSSTQDLLGISTSSQIQGPYEDTFELSVPVELPETTERDRILEDTVRVMMAGYSASKLAHAAQATLHLPIEYIRYRMVVDQKRYDWNDIVTQIFGKYRGDFNRLSARRGQIGYYRWNGYKELRHVG